MDQRTEGGGPPAAAFRIRRGTPADAPAAAQLHVAELSEGFLRSLGPRFLSRLYARISTSPGSFLLVAESEGTIIGFGTGTFDTKALYKRFFIRDGLFVAITCAPQIMRALPRALETMRHAASETHVDTPAEYLSLAVDSAWRGRGVGVAITEAFLDEMRNGGARSAKLIVGDSNPIIPMYERRGFKKTESFELHPGVCSVVMVWTAE
jgi:ribosomal protein S18 acetylase RimI-like enzyme